MYSPLLSPQNIPVVWMHNRCSGEGFDQGDPQEYMQDF